ncbi:TolC family protein [Luteitalea sp.]|uniref:TolC family protein n=1 Tax=Luteitalea sp. TaxID=2004800 RepID=UPI0025B8AB82|nr:TolC family protein [Luteitalea sp.]
MRLTVSLAAAVLAATVALPPTPAHAQSRSMETSDARVAELLRLVAGQQPAPAQPGTPVVPGSAAPVSTDLPLKIEDAVAMALEKNLDIAVERLNPTAFDFSLKALRAQFNPALTGTLGANSTTQLPTSQLIGGERVVNEQLTYNVGAQQALPWWGGQYSVAFNNRRQDNNNAFATFNPQYNATLQGQLILPLLRGRQIDNVRTQLRITQINRELSDVQVRTTVTETLANVRNAYWDLVFAKEVVSVAERSLQLAESLVADNKVRVEVGTLAPIDVIQAEAEAATRRQTLAALEAQAQTAELALKRLIVSGTSDPMWSARLSPVDRPTLTERPAPLEEALRNALNNRTDLVERKRNLEITDANLALLKNQRLPGANLIANYGLQGIGGTRILSRNPLTVEEGGYIDALDLLGQRDYPTWNVQVQFSYPLGTNPAAAQYERARIGLEQSLTQIRSLELQIATEVTNARLQVDANLKRVEASRVARELSQRRLEAEQSKFDVGLSTNYFVVQAQRDLLAAENTLLRAALDYQQSLVNFERAQLTSGRGGVTINTGVGAVTGTGATTGTGNNTGTGTNTNTGTGTGGNPNIPGGIPGVGGQ